MLLLKEFLPGLLVAELVSAVLLVLLAWRWKSCPCGPGIALGLGYISGHVVALGWPPFPGREAAEWMPWFAVVAMSAAILDCLVPLRRPIRGLIWLIVCATILWLLLRVGFVEHWKQGEGILWIAGLALGSLLLTWCLERIDREVAGPTQLSLILATVASGGSIALILSGSALLSQLAGILATSIGVICLVSAMIPGIREKPTGIAPVAAVLLTCLVLSGYFYAELPAMSAVLLLLAPAAGLIGRGGRLPGWKATIARAGVAGVVVLVAITIAFRTSPPFA